MIGRELLEHDDEEFEDDAWWDEDEDLEDIEDDE